MSVPTNRRKALQLLAAGGAVASLPVTLSSCATPSSDAQVLVIGAGLAGLNAALLLQEQGLDVQVIEASQRAGGRVLTLDEFPHAADAGGSEFSLVSYARITDRVRQLGLEMVPWRGNGVSFAFHVGGTIVAPEDWPAASVNRVQGPARNVPPPFLGATFYPRPSPLTSLQSWLEPSSYAYDVPFSQYLLEQGAGPEVMRLVEARAEADTLDDISALWLMRTARFNEVSGGFEPLRNLKGGMTRLIEGMTALLNRPVIFGTPVTGLATEADRVVLQDANQRTWRADFAVCTVPLPLLRQIDLQPGLPALQAAAVDEVPYGDHVDVFFDIDEPFWEVDGLPASLWTDGPLGLVIRVAGDSPNGYLWLAITGRAGQQLRNLPDADIMRRVAAELAAVRPSTQGRIRPMTVQNWSNYRWTQGHTAYRAPGQIQRFGTVLSEPHGRIHFAGEHTAQLAIGMEGAMESGERAAVEILARMG